MRKIFYFLILLIFLVKGKLSPVNPENPTFWSFLPAISALVLTLLEKNPVFSLGFGLLSSIFLLGLSFENLQKVFFHLVSAELAYVLFLYGILLGSLLGLWHSFGIAEAFGGFLSKKYVRTPRSAKIVAWVLGVLFFQGGTLSSAVVGSTVKPVADKVKVSHEELSYVVDSTSSPIALLIPFNAWPYYIQNFLTLPIFLSLQDKLFFYFKAIPYFFYAILAIGFALVLSLDGFWVSGKSMQKAAFRSREGKGLDRENAKSLLWKVPLQENAGKPWDFPLALLILLVTIVGGFFFTGKPAVVLGFGLAILFSILLLSFRIKFYKILKGLAFGIKNNFLGCLVLTLAIFLGKSTTLLGAAPYLLHLIPKEFPFYLMPPLLFILSSFLAIATGTSWGTYALLLPTTLPIVFAFSQDFAQGETFLLISFAALLNGGVFGDHISPVSDTTILSSLATGADLRDHVATQLVPATRAAFLSLLLYGILGYYYSH